MSGRVVVYESRCAINSGAGCVSKIIDFVHRSWPFLNKLFLEYINATMNICKWQSGTLSSISYKTQYIYLNQSSHLYHKTMFACFSSSKSIKIKFLMTYFSMHFLNIFIIMTKYTHSSNKYYWCCSPIKSEMLLLNI